MNDSYRRLPDAELAVMLALWDCGEEAPRAALDERLSGRGWSVNTVNTYLTRLCAKGFVRCRREGRANWYAPLVSREDYFRSESRSFRRTLCGGDAARFVAAVSDDLTPDEIAELEALVARLRRGKGGGGNG